MTRLHPKRSMLLATYMKRLEELNEGKFSSTTEAETRARLEGKIADMLAAGVEPSQSEHPMGIRSLAERERGAA